MLEVNYRRYLPCLARCFVLTCCFICSFSYSSRSIISIVLLSEETARLLSRQYSSFSASVYFSHEPKKDARFRLAAVCSIFTFARIRIKQATLLDSARLLEIGRRFIRLFVNVQIKSLKHHILFVQRPPFV